MERLSWLWWPNTEMNYLVDAVTHCGPHQAQQRITSLVKHLHATTSLSNQPLKCSTLLHVQTIKKTNTGRMHDEKDLVTCLMLVTSCWCNSIMSFSCSSKCSLRNLSSSNACRKNDWLSSIWLCKTNHLFCQLYNINMMTPCSWMLVAKWCNPFIIVAMFWDQSSIQYCHW